MNYQKFKILKFIKNCPDVGVSKVVIHNALNIQNSDLDNMINSLLKDNFITKLNYDKDELYSINLKGYDFIRNYPKILFKVIWDKYLFSIILSLFFFILGLLLG